MRERIFQEIMENRTVYLVDDVCWDPVSRRYKGSLLWHGVPINPVTLGAFVAFTQSSSAAEDGSAAVVGIVSSGLPWATALALSASRPLLPLRIEPHRYGRWNRELECFGSKGCVLVDNFVGSGQTLSRARQLVDDGGLTCRSCFVVEASGHHPGLAALLETSEKLRWLLHREYFSPVARGVVERLLDPSEDWHIDAEWVRGVRQQIRDRGGEMT